MARYLLMLLAFAPSHAQVQRDDLTTPGISYGLRVLEDLTTLEVTVEITDVTRPALHLAIPEWPPGSYSLRTYSQWLEGLVAESAEGSPLEVTRLDPKSWSVATNGGFVRVRYRIPDHVRRYGEMPSGPRTGLHIEGPETFVSIEGATHLPVTVRYVLPEGWAVANGLLPTGDPWVKRARDYDTFVDAPTILGHFRKGSFAVAGTRFDAVFLDQSQAYDFDLETCLATLEQVVTSQGRMFGSFPFPFYVFLFTSGGGGGLEHLNSTSIGYSAGRLKANPASLAGIVAHEFFHTWNVKRIKPEGLGPFDYRRESYTSSLWVAEGWTSYYGALTLTRTGLASPDDFLARLRGAAAGELNRASAAYQSVMDASRRVWHRREDEPAPVDYYGKGMLLGALIDLEIRQATANGKSLDDVLRFLNRWFGERGVGYQETDIERACTAISNHDFSEFFARHVAGTVPPPFARCLAYAGVDWTEEIERSTELPFLVREVGGALEVQRQPGLERHRVQAGDRITALDGVALDGRKSLRSRSPGDSFVLTVNRDGRERSLTVVAREKTATRPSWRWSPEPTTLQMAIRESWLGQR